MSGRETVQALLRLINTASEDAMKAYEQHGEVPALDSTSKHPLDVAEDAVALRKAVRILEGACEQLCDLLAPPAHTVINRAQALDWACIKVAIEARIADILSEHPEGLHIDELASLAQIDSQKLAHVLRLLATVNIFKEVKPDVFANNRISVYLQSNDGISALAYCQSEYGPRAGVNLFRDFKDPETANSWDPTKSPFMTTMAADGVKGTFFNWLIANPAKRAIFGRAMLGLGNVMNSLAILHHYPWSSIKTVCDVGSGVGAFSLPLAKMFPHLKITLFDLEATVAQAKEHWKQEFPEAVQESRVDFIAGDFFETLPATDQDVYYLRNIIHNWPDAEALKIMTTVRAAMGKNSRLLIHDYVLSHVKQTPLEHTQVETAPSPLLPNFGAGGIRSYNQDLTMLIMYNAKERNLDEFVAFASGLGLRLEKVWDLAEAAVLELMVADSNN
ncbi:hypothetical protein PQX77_019474 [Marasmius sp. AFHP31]|nr:hypothetical protein PQX77_019474 [Marasmius sp. AFHP31]